MRNIVNGNEGLNVMLNEIVNHELDKTLDTIIMVVESWEVFGDTVSREKVIDLLKTNKSK